MLKIQLLFTVSAWILVLFAMFEVYIYRKFSVYLTYLAMFLFSSAVLHNALYNPLYENQYNFVLIFKLVSYFISAIGFLFSSLLFYLFKEDLRNMFK